MSEHTPGPWGLLSSPHLDRSLLIGTPGTNVALVSCAGAAAKSDAQRDADAALICASPDLLAFALKSEEIHQHYLKCEECDDDGMCCEEVGELEAQAFALRKDALRKVSA